MFANARFSLLRRLNRPVAAVVALALSLGLFALPLAAASAADCAPSYTVQPGDNLYRIGLKFGIEWPRIAAANDLANPSLIFSGQVLCLPDANATPAVTTTPAATSQPSATSTPAATPAPGAIPSFDIIRVTAGQTVTIQGANFPPNQKFDVRMGKNGTMGVDGTLVTTQDSGATGTFAVTYTIPSNLKTERVIALRIENKAGYYTYGWFANQTAP